jgi:hypothetical protein
MIERLTARLLRRLVPGALALAGMLAPAEAQPGPGAAAGGPRNPVCVRLEAQLATVDRGTVDPARAEQIRRLEEGVNRQQTELDRLNAQSRRSGCESRGIFSLFSAQPAQCGPLTGQIAQARANLDRTIVDLQRLQSNSADVEGQRRVILAALGQSECGPQYRQFVNRGGSPGGGGGFFDNLFGGLGPGIVNPTINPDAPQGNTYRTLCVRTCDGYYFPISYSTVQGKFAEDEKICQAMCPAAEAVLYTHRNPGEDVSQAVSTTGRNYTELPTAFAYRRAFTPTCSCKAVGQTWADALRHLEDQTVERGDIVVNEERARLLSLPQLDAQGRPIRPAGAPKAGGPAPKGAAGAPKAGTAGAPKSVTAVPVPAPPAAAPPPAEEKAEDGTGRRPVRSVGPIFIPR